MGPEDVNIWWGSLEKAMFGRGGGNSGKIYLGGYFWWIWEFDRDENGWI